MTEFEIAAELFGGTNQAFVAWLATRPDFDHAGTAVQLNAFSAHKAAEAVPNRIAELERQVTEQGAVILDLRVQMADLLGGNRELTGMIDRVDQELAAMTAERDQALLRMEAAIATSHAFIEELVERRIRDATNAGVGMTPPGTVVHGPAVPFVDYPTAPAIPANALRHQSQAIGLLCTADSGRVRLGGYAPTLRCPTPRRCPNE